MPLTEQHHQNYWGITDQLLAGHASIVQEIGEKTFGVRRLNSIEETAAFAVNILCAMSVANAHGSTLPGIRVRLRTSTPEEYFHPLSMNMVTLVIPHPDDRTKNISLTTSLDNLASQLEIAADLSNDSRQAATLVKSLNPELQQETEDDFIARRAFEAFRAGKNAQAIPQNASQEQLQYKLLLQDVKNRLAEELIYVWLDRKNRGELTKVSNVELTVGLIYDETIQGNVLLEIAVSQRGKNGRVAFMVLPPWRIYEHLQTPRTKRLIDALTAIGRQDPFDYHKARTSLGR